MIKISKKLLLLITSALYVVLLCMPSFAVWGKTEKGGIYWLDIDNTFAVDGWKIIDDDNDGIGYYYYFNKNGFLQIDDITDDYYVVDELGRRIGTDGDPEKVFIEQIAAKTEEGVDDSIYSEEIMAQIKANQDSNIVTVNPNLVSSGTYLYNIETDEGPSPNDFIQETEKNEYILGRGVVLKKDTTVFDPNIDKHMSEHIVGGKDYSKKVNGTTFQKSKWKNVMALKGTGASIVFENEKNNFNKLKGRIATHYFTYSDRTTNCTLIISNDDTGEEIFSTSSFNYNSGVAFECVFPKKASKIRFELDVSGQYTSRVCYLRDCVFSYDKEAYEEELYDDEIEEEYIRRYGTPSDADEEEIEYVEDERDNTENVDPATHGKSINELSEQDILNMEYAADDDTVTDAMRASLSELKRQIQEAQEKRDQVSGPAFDKTLQEETKPKYNPDGSLATNVFAGVAEEGE